MARPFTSKIHAAAYSVAASGRFGDVDFTPAQAPSVERQVAMARNLLGRLEAGVYAVVSTSLIAVAAICLIAPLVLGAAMIIPNVF